MLLCKLLMSKCNNSKYKNQHNPHNVGLFIPTLREERPKEQTTNSKNQEGKAPTFNKGMCTSLNVSLGVRRAVSNSSAENSTDIFKRGLNNCKTKQTHNMGMHNNHQVQNRKDQSYEALTCRKLSTEANSHMDRSFHRGNCDGEGGSTSVVTILLHC